MRFLPTVCLIVIVAALPLLAAGASIQGTVTDAAGKPLVADVWVDMKSWPDGKFELTPHHFRTGMDGTFDMRLAGTPTGNWFVNVAAVAPGHAFQTAYGKGDGFPVFRAKLPEAHPVMLKVVDENGQPMPVRTRVRPVGRTAADGSEHGLYYPASEKLMKVPNAKGEVEFDCFAKGDRGKVIVWSARAENEREFVVTGKKNEVIILPPQARTPSEVFEAGKDRVKKFLFLGPKPAEKRPKAGHGLIVVLPGGLGNREFFGFTGSIYEECAPEGYVMAQLVAFKWQAGQKIVWPTKRDKVPGAKFTTEEYIDAVVKDIAKRVKIDKKKVFTLSWSSGGPAAYAAALRKKTPITGSFVAQSVFYRAWYPSLKPAKGRPFYILHSPTDPKCKFHLAEDARDQLKKAGARVEFVTYEGGHGWPPATRQQMIRAGFAWLDEEN